MSEPTPPFSDQSLAPYRINEKTTQIHKVEDKAPYVYQSAVYVAAVAPFVNIADFLANTGIVVADSWEWEPITTAIWTVYRNSKGNGFGPRSTYSGIRTTLKGAGYHFSAKFVQGWRLWQSWEMGNGWDRDDEFCAGFLVKTQKQYVFLDYTGYVIH